MTSERSFPRAPWHAPLTRRAARIRSGLPTLVVVLVAMGGIGGRSLAASPAAATAASSVAAVTGDGSGADRASRRVGDRAEEAGFDDGR